MLRIVWVGMRSLVAHREGRLVHLRKLQEVRSFEPLHYQARADEIWAPNVFVQDLHEVATAAQSDRQYLARAQVSIASKRLAVHRSSDAG